MTTDQEPNDDEQTSAGRPDPLFKVLTKLEAEQHGLQAIETEQQLLQETTRADLVLAVPSGVNLEGTMFDFFRAINVIEFKSENDPLNVREYLKNEMRTTLQFLQRKNTDLANILNVIVTSRSPDSFLAQAMNRGISFQPEEGRLWLLRAQIGFQDVAIVVCRDLPLEEVYYNWLVFAPSDSRKWKEYIWRLLKEGKEELLNSVKRIRPKELKMAAKDIMELALAEGFVPPQFSEAELEEMDELDEETAILALTDLTRRGRIARLRKILARLTTEDRLAGLKPEDRLAGLKPEDRLAGLKPEDRLAGLKPEDRLAGLSSEERQALLKALMEQEQPKNKRTNNPGQLK